MQVRDASNVALEPVRLSGTLLLGSLHDLDISGTHDIIDMVSDYQAYERTLSHSHNMPTLLYKDVFPNFKLKAETVTPSHAHSLPKDGLIRF